MANTVFKTTSNTGPPGPGTPRKGYTSEHKAGEHIFHEGDLGTEMYIINEGKVEILNLVGEE
ncbi:MAG TPA: cyclic nucleotide-binding domain-containing protein, partial [Thermoanaerobaculia bacterium]|nr:cyclic nucleotide-binding domain-containing protein [Thermoanaerobaculia bacterium]